MGSDPVDAPAASGRAAWAGIGSDDPAARQAATETLIAAAEAGDHAACADAAELALAGAIDGRGRALDWLRTAADAGIPRAQFRLGLAHMRGSDGAAPDPALAARWCAAAARQGLGEAQFNLALLHSEGVGVAADAAEAVHWLRIAAASGNEEADRCLDLIYAEPGQRPNSWEDAQTRTSVALASTDHEAPKRMRFAEYYVDPCVNLLIRRHGLSREQSEDIVQQFMLELEEPLEKGKHRGRIWKDSLRDRFQTEHQSDGKRFRPFLGRVVSNFALDWLRRERAPARQSPPTEAAGPDPETMIQHHSEAWGALLARFRSEASAVDPRAGRAYAAFHAVVADGMPQGEAVAHLGISERTLRIHLRQASELLMIWLNDLAVRHRIAEASITAGLGMLPGWLHYPTGGKRARALLLLALIHHRLGRPG